MDPALRWRDAESVDLIRDHWVHDAEGRQVNNLRDVHVACEGGFLHIAVPGRPEIQVVSAPGLFRVAYRPE